MTFIKVMIVLAFFILGGYYLYHMDAVNTQASSGLKSATDFFIDKSNQYITVVDYWANGPRQTYTTSGSESISFVAAAESTPIESHSNEIIITPKEETKPIDIEPLPPTLPSREELILMMCEDNFKACVDRAHATYGVYIQVNDVKIYNDVSAEAFYDSRKSDYQPIFSTMSPNYPIVLISAEAVGLGKFVATCKDGEYLVELNNGLPC
jgi:hypothetical protein